ncbi:MAG: hypothetical protein ACKVHE_30775 [Planctomycetales bacterium]
MSLHQRLKRLEVKQIRPSVSIWAVTYGEAEYEDLDAAGKALYDSFFAPIPEDLTDPIEAEIERLSKS